MAEYALVFWCQDCVHFTSHERGLGRCSIHGYETEDHGTCGNWENANGVCRDMVREQSREERTND